MKELRKAAGRALVALLQNDSKTALEALNAYKICMDDGEPILTPGTMNPPGLGNSHPTALLETWAVGIEVKHGEFGMVAGPYPTEDRALEFTPTLAMSHEGPVRIIHFNHDDQLGPHDEIVHTWGGSFWRKE